MKSWKEAKTHRCKDIFAIVSLCTHKHSTSFHSKAMTLAEVLITIVIVGVVASITIPNLVNNKAKQETVAKLQKEYTTLAQAVKLSENDNGPNSTWDWGTATNPTSIRQSFDTYWAPYLKIIKYCSSYSDCGYASNNIKFLTGNPSLSLIYDSNSRTPVSLADGSVLVVIGGTIKLIYIDINGGKGPNQYGKDIFRFIVDANKGFMPENYASGDDCRNSGDGLYCAAKIIHDSWQIKDDYSW